VAGDPYKYFRIEARELVDGLAKDLLALEQRGHDAAVVAKLLRGAHTLKGAARVVKHRALADAAHALEGVLEPLRAAAGVLDPQAIALVDRMTAELAGLGGAVAAPVAHAPPQMSSALDDIAQHVIEGLADVHRQIAALRGAPDLDARLDRLDRDLREVRRDADQLRLAPASSMATTLERTARDAAQAQHKRVAFAMIGGSTRVDALVLSAVSPALVQLVRNAVAHGIAASGTVTIAVALRGSRAVFSCSDDGRGIDLEAVGRVARAKGLDGDPLELLLRGGLTTATGITEVAGRGIGLDLAREAVKSLGGELVARTGATGTTFELIVPIMAAAVEVLGVGCEDRELAIPVTAISRVAHVAGIARTPAGDRVDVEGEWLPFAALARLVGGTRGTAPTVVVVEGVAIGIDRLFGVEDVVLRMLPAGVPVDPIVWGVALDHGGLPRPILEPVALAAAARRLPPYDAPVPAKRPPILVVDDSLTTRMLEQSILEGAGFEVVLAASAEEGLEKVEHGPFGMVLVDVEMPGMDGFGFIEALRAHPRHAKLPAVLVTSRDAAEDRRRGDRAGANGYIVKGRFDQLELLALIGKLVPA
jgi:two-component system chemotaxis sensor kinase CheA